jgi:divalent metal cation (Fe/Co/Zn/Cd) transporter
MPGKSRGLSLSEDRLECLRRAGKSGRHLVPDRLEALDARGSRCHRMTTGRNELVTSALRLSYFTIGWNGAIGAAALAAGLTTGSLALAGFALNALLDSFASMVLVWRFKREQRDPIAAEHLERRAQSWIITAMLLAALYVGIQAARALIGGSHPEPSAFGFALAAISLVVLPVLGLLKMRVAARLGSPALRGDGVLTLAAAALAGITLVALAVNSALDWWWADPLAALLIATALATEATRVAVRHRFG